MKIKIDTTDSDKIMLDVDGQMFTAVSRVHKSQHLLEFLNEVLKQKKKTVDDIDEIEVNCGPGSFTGIRVGVSVAQTLAWVLQIPVNGLYLEKGESLDIVYED